MTIIHATATDQVLTATRMPMVSCNNQNTVRLYIHFDASWDGYAKSAVFHTSKDPTVYEVILSADGSNGHCLVPAEVLIEEATLYIGVRGIKTTSNEVKSSTLVKYKVLPGTPSMVISAPSPNVYQQLLNENAVLRSRISELEASGTVDGSEIIGVRTGANGVVYDTAGDAVRAQISALSEKLTDQGERLHNIDGGEGFFRECDFEIGNVSISNSGWDYTKESYSAWRVKSKEGKSFPLEVGDVIRLTDYSYVRCYLGWLEADGTYGYKDWITEDYTIKVKGEYIILLALVNESTSVPKLTSAIDLLKYLKIDKINPESTMLEKIAKVIDTAESLSVPATTVYEIRDINHRGFNQEAPENTLSAFKSSKIRGFKYVETDVSWTADNIPVLLHDDSINRTARNADGTKISNTVNISDITYNQALAYDFGIWKGSAYVGTKIPKYSDFLRLCRDIGLHPYIEIKGNITDEQAEILVNEAKKVNMMEHLTFLSFYIKSLRKIVDIYPRCRVGYVQSTVEGGWADSTQLDNVLSLQSNVNQVFVDLSITHLDDCIAPFIENGIAVEVWCPNTKDEILYLNPYVSGVTSDSLFASKVLRDASLATL